jgi:hypothetical protein
MKPQDGFAAVAALNYAEAAEFGENAFRLEGSHNRFKTDRARTGPF